MRQVGYLCDSILMLDVDDELLFLQYDSATNRIVNVSKFNDEPIDRCREIDVDIDQIYTTKYYPRVYYTIYKLQFSNNVGYLLERYDGTSASSRFYPCSDFKTCGSYIETLEDL